MPIVSEYRKNLNDLSSFDFKKPISLFSRKLYRGSYYNDYKRNVQGIPLQDYIEEQWATIANTDKAIREDRHRRKKEGLAVDMVNVFEFWIYN